MECYLRSFCRFVFLILLCTLLSVRQSGSTYVPGRCLCPRTQPGVRGPDRMTVIVTLKKSNEPVCISPDGLMGKQLIRCWNRAHKLGRNVKVCLRRSRSETGVKDTAGHPPHPRNEPSLGSATAERDLYSSHFMD
uniref:Chemokine interleukin-8-like domain-containing protein n=1 Tax=Neogobius melanostomus TaxID=47308 RepID=A0A8C6TUQ5_9GOBI